MSKSEDISNVSTSSIVSNQSKLSGLKPPSKLAKPTTVISKPISTAANNEASSKQIINEENENLENFKLNDKVWVNGTKPGTIAFIGETQFKEGIWAGVILETTDGKNNGTLNGVTYFKTDENRGVFCRLNKLTRTQQQQSDNQLNESIVAATTTTTTATNDNSFQLKIGDRVNINSSVGGVKTGILRYIGETDFAKGEWAGVELDEKLGKNDGSVGNKRYFQCEPMYGVFAPIQKVEPIKSKVQTNKTTNNLGYKQMSGSQESLVSNKSSIFSTASGINKLQAVNKNQQLLNTTTASKPSNVTATPTNSNLKTTANSTSSVLNTSNQLAKQKQTITNNTTPSSSSSSSNVLQVTYFFC
jgi:dynactin complex subunit